MADRANIIWSNENLDYEDWREFLEEEYPELTEAQRVELMYEMNADHLDDERVNLDIQLSRPILVIGDLGRWNGRVMGYKEIPSGNIRDCLYSDTDYSTWYMDRLAEQERYRQHLLTLPPEEILDCAYAYTTREDILLSLEYNDLTSKQCQALLKSPCPLSDVFQAWEKCESAHMEELWSVVEDRANTVIQAAKAKSHREER